MRHMNGQAKEAKNIALSPDRPIIGIFTFSGPTYGGSVYEKMMADVLDVNFDVRRVDISPLFPGFASRPQSLSRVLLAQRQPGVHLWIRNEISTMAMFGPSRRSRNIMLMHHYDDHSGPIRIVNHLLGRRLIRNARRCDSIVVVSRYWKDFLERRNVKNIRVIYNGFDIEKYTFCRAEIEDFKTRYELTERPILYLGNCQKAKGIVNTLSVLDGSAFHLVTSGFRDIDPPCRHLDLSFRDYRLLLAASSVTILMSEIKEGWNRIAHESMLAGTPVIGSGAGGMRELLEGGLQEIAADLHDLPVLVQHVLRRRSELSRKGADFARSFTVKRFADAWRNLIEDTWVPNLRSTGHESNGFTAC